MKAATLWVSIGILCLLTILATPVRATLITFEDLDPYVWHWDERNVSEAWEARQINDTPLTDHYAHVTEFNGAMGLGLLVMRRL